MSAAGGVSGIPTCTYRCGYSGAGAHTGSRSSAEVEAEIRGRVQGERVEREARCARAGMAGWRGPDVGLYEGVGIVSAVRVWWEEYGRTAMMFQLCKVQTMSGKEEG